MKQTKVRQNNKNHVKIRLYVFSALVFLLLLATAFADTLAPYDPYAQNYSISLMPPDSVHIMGTDMFGRDIFSRVLVGARSSIPYTLILVLTTTISGTASGMICGYIGGLPDAVIMRISDVCLAFPGFALALAIASILNGGTKSAVIALAVTSWPKYARIARARTLSLKEADFIYAARLSGGKPYQIIIRHILPNISGSVLATAMPDIGTMMMELSGLSFLGLGAKPPAAEWGSMMSGGKGMLLTHPWIVISPGIAIFFCVSLFNLLGDTVRDWLDPKGKIS